ncbi:hypothetical protein BSKO_01180 [Bryopsis sp. KO-2023]|nr:hypothetical protein BSKO_01180 [Bryopsis sp. KO-2023]
MPPTARFRMPKPEVVRTRKKESSRSARCPPQNWEKVADVTTSVRQSEAAAGPGKLTVNKNRAATCAIPCDITHCGRMLRRKLPSTTQQHEEKKLERTFFYDKALTDREKRLKRLSEEIRELEIGCRPRQTSCDAGPDSFSFDGAQSPESTLKAPKRTSGVVARETSPNIGDGLESLDRSLANCESRIERLHYRIRGGSTSRSQSKGQRLLQTTGSTSSEVEPRAKKTRSKSDDFTVGRFESMVESSWNLKGNEKIRGDRDRAHGVRGGEGGGGVESRPGSRGDNDSARQTSSSESSSLRLKATIRKAQEGNVSMQGMMDSLGGARVSRSTSSRGIGSKGATTSMAAGGAAPVAAESSAARRDSAVREVPNGSVKFKEMQELIAVKDAEIKRLKATLEKVNEICALESKNMGLRTLVNQMPAVVKKNQDLKKEAEAVEKLNRENAELQEIVARRDRARQENARLKKLVETMEDLVNENNALERETRWSAQIEARNAFLHERAKMSRRLQKENERLETNIKELSPLVTENVRLHSTVENVNKMEDLGRRDASEISLQGMRPTELEPQPSSKQTPQPSSRSMRENGSRSTRSSSTRSSRGVFAPRRGSTAGEIQVDERGLRARMPSMESRRKRSSTDQSRARRALSDTCFPMPSLFGKGSGGKGPK